MWWFKYNLARWCARQNSRNCRCNGKRIPICLRNTEHWGYLITLIITRGTRFHSNQPPTWSQSKNDLKAFRIEITTKTADTCQCHMWIWRFLPNNLLFLLEVKVYGFLSELQALFLSFFFSFLALLLDLVLFPLGFSSRFPLYQQKRMWIFLIYFTSSKPASCPVFT